MVNIKKFPYMNTDQEGKYFWLQKNKLDPELLSPANIAKIPVGEHKPILVKFEVFQKFKLHCGFPKRCGELTPEEIEINGSCGLEEFLNTPITIDLNGVTDSFFFDAQRIAKKNNC